MSTYDLPAEPELVVQNAGLPPTSWTPTAGAGRGSTTYPRMHHASPAST